MSDHRADIDWKLGDAEFAYESYPRDHTWTFENGVRVAASSAPAYLGNPERVDPEEAFVAAVAGCHILTFLAIAAKKRYVVRSYRDSAVGRLEKNDEGRLAMTTIRLEPRVEFDGDAPDAEQLAKMHDSAHHACFIANSVRTRVTID